jgi:glycine/D-amino acid oxidase-like deaminating enzyme
MNVVIIGCGVVGAAIAYELSLAKGLKITVLDKQPPAQASTGAALGVLMSIISHKIKGKAWQMRQTSIQRYESLIPELEELTNRKIPFNRQGILMLLTGNADPPSPPLERGVGGISEWEKLSEIRHSQGYQLEIWDAIKLGCPT